jgi:hypothetical protein
MCISGGEVLFRCLRAVSGKGHMRWMHLMISRTGGSREDYARRQARMVQGS